jgi:hypothetical protein
MAKAERNSPTKKRKSGIPTGNAGEYAVMAELLARGFDAQLADRNTKGYDLLVGMANLEHMKKVQVKTVRAAPWYVRQIDFKEPAVSQITVYVLLGKEDRSTAFRYFITKNSDLVSHVIVPNPNWKTTGFMGLSSIQSYEENWLLFNRELKKRT